MDGLLDLELEVSRLEEDSRGMMTDASPEDRWLTVGIRKTNQYGMSRQPSQGASLSVIVAPADT